MYIFHHERSPFNNSCISVIDPISQRPIQKNNVDDVKNMNNDNNDNGNSNDDSNNNIDNGDNN